jgi:uncharacterized protein (DUF427 family)
LGRDKEDQVSLSKGSGPFGENRTGIGNYRIDSPKHILYLDPSSKHVRGFFAGEMIVDSIRAKLLHETGHLPVYYFPLDDVRDEFLEVSDHTTHCPFKGDASYRSVVVGDKRAQDAMWMYENPNEEASFLQEHVAFYFNRIDSWFEEDEEIFVHPRDPYTRIDILPSSRHVRISLEGQDLAETDRPMLLFETSLPTRYYISKQDVRMDLLEVSAHITECPYKGRPVHYSAPRLGDHAKHIAWCYENPQPEAQDVQGLIAFYNERVDLEIDGRKVAK